MTTRDKLQKALLDLSGERTPDEIAEHLRELGIKGTLASSCNCAISNFLKTKGFNCSVLPSDTPTRGYARDVHIYGVVGLPIHLNKFAINFDMRRYPFLEKK